MVASPRYVASFGRGLDALERLASSLRCRLVGVDFASAFADSVSSVASRGIRRNLASVEPAAAGLATVDADHDLSFRSGFWTPRETLTSAFLFDATDDGRAAIYAVRNPDKLRRLAATATLP